MRNANAPAATRAREPCPPSRARAACVWTRVMVKLKLEAHMDYTMWTEAFPRLRDDINDYRLRNRSELSPVLRLMLEETAPVFLLVNAVVLCALRSPDGAPLKVPLDTAAGAAFIISNTMLGENIGRGIKKADSLKCHPERWWYAGFRKGLELCRSTWPSEISMR